MIELTMEEIECVQGAGLFSWVARTVRAITSAFIGIINFIGDVVQVIAETVADALDFLGINKITIKVPLGGGGNYNIP